MAYRKEFLDGLTLLARAFDIAEAKGALRPVIVGGSAVEYYTGSELTSGDFDLVAPDDALVAEALLEVGFHREDRAGFLLRGFYHRDLLLSVEFVSGALFDGQTDRDRLQVLVLDEKTGGKVVFPPLEDMIADRLGQYASDRSGRGDMLEQAKLLVSFAETALDMDYLKIRVYQEGAETSDIKKILEN